MSDLPPASPGRSRAQFLAHICEPGLIAIVIIIAGCLLWPLAAMAQGGTVQLPSISVMSFGIEIFLLIGGFILSALGLTWRVGRQQLQAHALTLETATTASQKMVDSSMQAMATQMGNVQSSIRKEVVETLGPLRARVDRLEHDRVNTKADLAVLKQRIEELPTHRDFSQIATSVAALVEGQSGMSSRLDLIVESLMRERESAQNMIAAGKVVVEQPK